VLAASFDLVLNFVVVVVFLFVAGITPTVSWLELPLIVGLIAVVATGVSLILSSLYVRHRDIDQLWGVAGQALFFLTPVFYTLTKIPAPFSRALVLANPIAASLSEARHALLDPNAPSAAALAGGWPYLLVPAGVAASMLALGSWLYRRESPRAAEFI